MGACPVEFPLSLADSTRAEATPVEFPLSLTESTRGGDAWTCALWSSPLA